MSHYLFVLKLIFTYKAKKAELRKNDIGLQIFYIEKKLINTNIRNDIVDLLDKIL